VRRPGYIGAPLLCAALVLGACMQTTYRPLEAAHRAEKPFSRDVYFRVADAFYADPPSCAVVLPSAQDGVPAALAHAIEQSLALRLGQRIARVIGPRERRAAERALALDTRHEADRRYSARHEACPAALEWRLTHLDDSHFLVWSQKKLGLEVRLARAEDGATLWQAAHGTRRADGGLPLSLLSLPVAAAEATLFNRDGDQLPSMIDDVTRRLIVTLPDAN
jgi:hypothetical protein